MSGVRLTLRDAPPERLDLAGLRPDLLAGLTEREIAALPVGTSRLGLTVGDCFGIARRDGPDLVLDGGSARLDDVGALWSGGELVVEGDVGQRLGRGLTGGRIVVRGAAGPFAATQATGGTVIVEGDAGDSAGGALYGRIAGLAGATLLIRAAAGERLGDRMRSGLIVVGAAGAFAASRMIAGTIVADSVGDSPGYGMRRGTLLARRFGALLPTFAETGRHRFVVARLLERALKDVAPHAAPLARGEHRRYAGDLATLGKGELLKPAD